MIEIRLWFLTIQKLLYFVICTIFEEQISFFLIKDIFALELLNVLILNILILKSNFPILPL